MKNVSLFLFFFTICCTCFSQSIRFGDKEFSMEIEVYRPPIIIVKQKSIEDGSAPEWWPPYRALNAFNEFDNYEEWKTFFSLEHRERFNFSEKVLINAKKEMENHPDWPPEFCSVFYSIRISVKGGREFMIVKSAEGRIVDWSDNLLAMGGWTQTHFYEKINGIWVNQLFDEVGFVADLPYGNLSALKAIMSLGVFVPGDKIPLKIPN